jgi:hypothetical protein
VSKFVELIEDKLGRKVSAAAARGVAELPPVWPYWRVKVEAACLVIATAVVVVVITEVPLESWRLVRNVTVAVPSALVVAHWPAVTRAARRHSRPPGRSGPCRRLPSFQAHPAIEGRATPGTTLTGCVARGDRRIAFKAGPLREVEQSTAL